MSTVSDTEDVVNSTGLILEIGRGDFYALEIERPEDGGVLVRLTDRYGETFTAEQDASGRHACDCGLCVTYNGCPHTVSLEGVGIFTYDPIAWPWRAERESRARAVKGGVS